MLKKYHDFILMLLAGGIAIFAFAPFSVLFIMCITVFMLFHVVYNLDNKINVWRVLFLGYIFGLSYFNTQLYWIYYSIHYIINAKVIVAIIAQIGFTVFLASYMALAILVYFKVKTKNELFNIILLFPSIWVFFDWVRGWFLGGFSWCDIGYSVVDLPFFKGIFPILGEYGVTFFILSILGGAYYLAVRHFLVKNTIGKNKFRIVIIYLMFIFLSMTVVNPIQYTKKYGKQLKIALLQGNVPVNMKWTDDSNLRIYKEMIKNAHASIIMIPETAISKFEDELPTGYIDSIGREAKANGGELIAGMPKAIDDNDNYVNAAVLLTNPDEPYYAKYHLVPYGEYIPAKWFLGPLYKFVSLPMVNFSRGAINQPPLIVANEKLAFNICYENGFGGELIQNAKNSTLMVNISDMVWYGRTIAMYQHLQLSQARALENQRYFIQDTNTSITAIINPEGQVQSQLPIFKRDTLTDYVQGRVGETPFEMYGNWLIISFISLMILIAIVFKSKCYKRKS